MTIRALTLLCLLLFTPLPLGAEGLRFSGDVSLGVSSVDARHGNGRIDALLSIPLVSLRDRPLAAEIGGLIYFARANKPHETYAALAYDDRLRMGYLRPAYDLVLPSVFALTAPAVAETRLDFARALTTVEAVRVNAVPFGLSYTETAGDLRWALSLHDARDGGFRTASAAAEWRADGWSLAGAVEGVWDQSNDWQGLNAKLGGRWQSDGLALGLAWLHPDANARPDALAFDLSYQLSSYLTLLAFGEVTENRSADAYGLAARHEVGPGTEMVLAVTDGDAMGTELHLTVTRRY